jgi:hypothetical protein
LDLPPAAGEVATCGVKFRFWRLLVRERHDLEAVRPEETSQRPAKLQLVIQHGN